MGGTHALLAPSAAKRWMNCAPSARLEDTLPETRSDYADEGSLAHSIAELKARKAFTDPMGPKKFKTAYDKLKTDPHYDSEMHGYTDDYIDYLSKIVHGFNTPPAMAVEKELRGLGKWAPESFGRSDFIAIGDKKMYVVDFKYGKGIPVSAVKNEQMLCYALGAWEEYSFLHRLNTITLAIFQPRLDNISEWEITTNELLNWAKTELKPKAETAFKGGGDFNPGEYCQFCRAKALCAARADFNMMLEMDKGKKPPLLTNDDVGELLVKALDLAKWIKDLEDYALNECLNGNGIKGWKIVEGRSVRKLQTVEAFKVLIEKGYDEELLYTREPITLTKTEKLIGKKSFDELLTPYVIKPQGKPTLVQESDPREVFQQQISADEDFKEVI